MNTAVAQAIPALLIRKRRGNLVLKACDADDHAAWSHRSCELVHRALKLLALVGIVLARKEDRIKRALLQRRVKGGIVEWQLLGVCNAQVHLALAKQLA